jgi:RHS repeat-associated protein
MERNDAVAQHFDHARTQQYNLGRFLSTDTVPGHQGSPQSWNRYAFAENNPLKLVDPNGKWPTKTVAGLGGTVHQNAIDRNPNLSPADKAVVKRLQVDIDKLQGPADSYRHFMAAPGQSADAATRQINAFLKSEVALSIGAERAGDHSNALVHLASVVHTGGDGTSPEHGPSEQWKGPFREIVGPLILSFVNGTGPLGAITAPGIQHMVLEDFDPGAGSDLDRVTNSAIYLYQTQQPCPGDCFAYLIGRNMVLYGN